MSKLLKVTLEYEDSFAVLEGEQAEKWLSHGNSLAVMAQVRNNSNPFANDPVTWVVTKKSDTNTSEQY